MPGPTTEVLIDDLKELRSDLHKVEVSVVTEIHKVDKTVAELGAEFRVFGWLLGATLATTLSGGIGSATWAGTLASRVSTLDGRSDRIDGRLDRIDTRLDRVESSLARLLELTQKGKAIVSVKK